MRYYSDEQVEAAAKAALASFPSSTATRGPVLDFYSQFLRVGVAILTAKPIRLTAEADTLLRVMACRVVPRHVQFTVAREELRRKGLICADRLQRLDNNRSPWVVTALGEKHLRENP